MWKVFKFARAKFLVRTYDCTSSKPKLISTGEEVVPSQTEEIDISKCHAGNSKKNPTYRTLDSLEKGGKQEETEMSETLKL